LDSNDCIPSWVSSIIHSTALIVDCTTSIVNGTKVPNVIVVVDYTTSIVNGAIVLNGIVVGDGAGISDDVLVDYGAIINYGISIRDAAVGGAIVGDGAVGDDGAGVVDGGTEVVGDGTCISDGNDVVKDARIDDITVVDKGARINQCNATNGYRIYRINC